MEMPVVTLAIILILAAAMFSGCVSDSQGLANQQGGSASHAFGNRTGMRNGNGSFGNMTDEQRQQMAQQAAAACDGKAAGDSCAISFGRMNATAVCVARNSSLVCTPQMGNVSRRGWQNGTAPQPQ